MSKMLWNSLLISPAILGAVLVGSASAIAAEAQAASSVDAAQIQSLQAQTSDSQSIASATVPEVAKEFSTVEVASTPSEQVSEAVAPSEQVSEAVAPTVTVQQPTLLAQTPVDAAAEADTSNLEQVNRYSREGRVNRSNNLSQVTSVSQLSDVQPTDWAFQALQSLVERYGCIAGYPDGTYKGNRAMTRYEFAAGLNACLDRVNELIAAGTTGLATKEDLATLQKLQEEFAAELATLRGRVDALEARTTELEANQFSTTTKLAGEVIFAVTDEFNQGVDNETVFQNRVRLSFNTSFSGKDLLITRLDAGNAGLFRTTAGGSLSEGTQTFNLGDTDNDIVLGWLAYYFPVGDNLQVYIPAYAGLHYDYAPTASPLLDNFDGGNGALSYFGQRNPIYAIGGGTGIGATFKFGNAISVSAGYLADNSPLGGLGSANVPESSGGLFDGSYAALGQVTFNLGDALQIAGTYVKSYRQQAIFDTGFGSSVVGTSAANFVGADGAEVDAFGASASFKFGNNFALNGFLTYAEADYFVGDEGEIWSYGLGLGIADFGRKGSLLGLIAGVQPYLGNSRNITGDDNDRPYHFEGFYKFQLTDNISITPGVIWLVNPGQEDDNDDAIIGTVRTTFTF